MTNLPTMANKHMIRFFMYMFAYVAAILAMSFLRESMADSPFYLGVIILPALFVFLALRESYYGVLAMDEMIRRIHLEAIFLSACLTGGITFTWSLFTNAGLPDFQAIYVLPMLLIFWGLGTTFRKRDYE